MFQALTNWAANVLLPLGGWGLFLVAFAESSFFPIPPDVLLFPLVLATPRLALVYAAVCTAASVLGALFGYFLGARAGRTILRRLTSEATIAKAEELFQRWGGWAVGIAAFTPIPFKVFTIAGGLFRVDPASFVFASVIGRGGRFFAEAVLLQLYGQPMLAFLGKNFEWLTIGVTAVVVSGYVLFRMLRRRGARPAGEPGEVREAWLRRVARKLRRFVDRRLETWGEHAIYFLAGWVAFALALLGLGKIVNEVFLEAGPLWEDLWLLRFVHGWTNPALTRLMLGITWLGSAGAVLGLAGGVVAVLAVRRRYVEAVTTAISTGGAGLLVELLKVIFQRPRPNVFPPLAVERTYAFPSGHTMLAVSFYGALLYWLLRRGADGPPRPTVRWAGAAGLALLIGAIGLSRIYLGVHWPTDVLAGYAAGGAWLLACLLLAEELRAKTRTSR